MESPASLQPEFILAGPGAGKTHGMVERVVSSLSQLEPHRFAAVVTYTHAATKVIRQRLSGCVALPRNVFIGTTHSFVARFILKPYGTHLGGLPAERIYSAVNFGPKVAPAKRQSILKAIERKGVVDYSKMLSIAAKLVASARVRKQIGERIQFLFIDEFQDITSHQLTILEQLVKAGRTSITVVGDPEQYISSFTYAGTGRRRPESSKLPFRLFQAAAKETQNIDNHRNSGQLVAFANQFRCDLVQVAVSHVDGREPVHYLAANDLDKLVTEFRRRADEVPAANPVPERLYLASRNACFDSVRERHGIVHIGSSMQRGHSLHSDAREFLADALSCPEREAIGFVGGDVLAWRAIAYRLLVRCKEASFGFPEFNTFFKDEFGKASSSSRGEHLEDLFENLKGAIASSTTTTSSEISSSIHKAKGLEADSVLVVASSTNELRKFLETSVSKRAADKQDTCRLGYVAATRARKLLCFGCLESIDEGMHKLLKSVGMAVQA